MGSANAAVFPVPVGGTDEVPTAKHDRDGPQLDGSGLGITGGLHSAENGIRKVESAKRHKSLQMKKKRTRPRSGASSLEITVLWNATA